jgi:5-(carboxyamino)imidazole ribonucleotide mutase
VLKSTKIRFPALQKPLLQGKVLLLVNKSIIAMEPRVSIIMGSTSDLSIMEEAAKVLNDFEIPFEMHALSAHRTPEMVEEFAKSAYGRGIRVIIAGAGMAAHLPGVIAAFTPVPVIGVPIKSSLEGFDSILAILQMPPGIPVATVALNGARNAAILAAQILSTGDPAMLAKVIAFKADLKGKVIQANLELGKVSYTFKVN